MTRSLLLLIATTASAQILWREPAPSKIAPPKAPFTYVREDPSGTQPKLFVRDAADDPGEQGRRAAHTYGVIPRP